MSELNELLSAIVRAAILFNVIWLQVSIKDAVEEIKEYIDGKKDGE